MSRVQKTDAQWNGEAVIVTVVLALITPHYEWECVGEDRPHVLPTETWRRFCFQIEVSPNLNETGVMRLNSLFSCLVRHAMGYSLTNYSQAGHTWPPCNRDKPSSLKADVLRLKHIRLVWQPQLDATGSGSSAFDCF